MALRAHDPQGTKGKQERPACGNFQSNALDGRSRRKSRELGVHSLAWVNAIFGFNNCLFSVLFCFSNGYGQARSLNYGIRMSNLWKPGSA